LLVWNSKKAMLVHYNKSNTSSTTSPTEINMRVTLYLKDTTKEMLRVMPLLKSLRLTNLYTKDGTMLNLMMDHIPISDSTE
jgi:hypothetical protein